MTGRTEIRMQEIRRRTRRYRQRYERRTLSRLTVCCLLLLAGIGSLLSSVHPPGVSAEAVGYGAVLLRSGTSTYIVVAIAAFVAGAALTALCIRCRKQNSSRMDHAEEKEN